MKKKFEISDKLSEIWKKGYIDKHHRKNMKKKHRQHQKKKNVVYYLNVRNNTKFLDIML